jgi:lysozyme family protein
MADFKIAVNLTLKHEGGYVNNPNDKGGATNYGITQADMPGVDMRTITPDQAIAYYAEHYWKPLYSQINDQNLANKLFDMGVLFGVGTAVKLLQLSLSSGITVVSDGAFGPNTLAALNERGNIDSYRTVLYNHVMDVINRNPGDAEFVQGWTNRIAS